MHSGGAFPPSSMRPARGAFFGSASASVASCAAETARGQRQSTATRLVAMVPRALPPRREGAVCARTAEPQSELL
jgi:hypothetical protein